MFFPASGAWEQEFHDLYLDVQMNRQAVSIEITSQQMPGTITQPEVISLNREIYKIKAELRPLKKMMVERVRETQLQKPDPKLKHPN